MELIYFDTRSFKVAMNFRNQHACTNMLCKLVASGSQRNSFYPPCNFAVPNFTCRSRLYFWYKGNDTRTSQEFSTITDKSCSLYAWRVYRRKFPKFPLLRKTSNTALSWDKLFAYMAMVYCKFSRRLKTSEIRLFTYRPITITDYCGSSRMG